MNNKIIKTLLVIVISAALVGCGILGYTKYKSNKAEKAETREETKETDNNADNNANSEKTYTKEELEEKFTNGELKTVQATDNLKGVDGVYVFFYEKFMEWWDISEDKIEDQKKKIQEDADNGIISEWEKEVLLESLGPSSVKAFGIKQIDVDDNDPTIYNVWYVCTYTVKDPNTGEEITKETEPYNENPYSLGRVQEKADGSYMILNSYC